MNLIVIGQEESRRIELRKRVENYMNRVFKTPLKYFEKYIKTYGYIILLGGISQEAC